MVGASDNTNRIMRDLKQSLDDWDLYDQFKEKSTEYLMQVLDAIRGDRYPTKSHANVVNRVLRDRVSPGTVLIWGEQWLAS